MTGMGDGACNNTRLTSIKAQVMKRVLVIAIGIAMYLVVLPGLYGSVLYAQPGAPNQTRRAADIDVAATPALAPDGVRRVQAALQKKGMSPGHIDGIIGPLTKEAIRRFQDRYGMKATGEIDNQTLFALGEVELAN